MPILDAICGSLALHQKEEYKAVIEDQRKEGKQWRRPTYIPVKCWKYSLVMPRWLQGDSIFTRAPISLV